MKGYIQSLCNIHQGTRCFVVGAGPSLALQDISFIHNDSNVVISVNSSILLMPWDHGGDAFDVMRRIWISNDSMCLHWDYFRKVLVSDCIRIYRNNWVRYEKKFRHRSFYYFCPRKDESTISRLHCANGDLCSISSVPTAIDLALYIGCRSIYLLGVDHLFDGDKTHFWHYWPKEKQPRMCGRLFDHDIAEQKDIFQKNLRSFQLLKDYAAEIGVLIYNCSPLSNVNMFERISLSEVQNEKP